MFVKITSYSSKLDNYKQYIFKYNSGYYFCCANILSPNEMSHQINLNLSKCNFYGSVLEVVRIQCTNVIRNYNNFQQLPTNTLRYLYRREVPKRKDT